MTTPHDKLDKLCSDFLSTSPSDIRATNEFGWYLEEIYSDPLVTRNAHQRLADMFEHYGKTYDESTQRYTYDIATTDPLGDGRNTFYGTNIHTAIHEFVNKVKSGARGLGPERRILLLLGPVGSGKSHFDTRVREYFEDYTAQDAGRMYTFQWVNLCDIIDDQDPSDNVVRSQMNQDPLVLLPQAQRQEVLDELNELHDKPYELTNTQTLDPESDFYMEELLTYYQNDLSAVLSNHIEVVRLVADENKRQCVETFEPKDKKNQDETELTGDVNYAKIAIYGESDPRAFDYSGAFCNANRGVFSGEELLKLQKEFLYDFLHASQEKTIKPKNNPRIDIDQVIVGRTNMPEFLEKTGDEKMEAFNDRTKRVDYPYVLEYDEESRIYEKMLRNANIPEVHVEPHTLEMAGLFAVLSRLKKPDSDTISLLKKAKAYNGEAEHDDIDVRKLSEEAEDEGLYGISARFVGDEIAEAIMHSLHTESNSLSALTVFEHFENNLENHGSLDPDMVDQYYENLEVVRKEYEERAIEDVRHALAYNSEELKLQGEKYLDNVMAYIDDDTLEDDLTGVDQEPDETFMRSVEVELEIPKDRKDDFRQEVSHWISRRARLGEAFDPTDNPRLLRALERKIWSDKKHNINFSALVSAGENVEDEKSSWVKSLVDRGYSEEGAVEALEFAGAKVAQAELEEN